MRTYEIECPYCKKKIVVTWKDILGFKFQPSIRRICRECNNSFDIVPMAVLQKTPNSIRDRSCKSD